MDLSVLIPLLNESESIIELNESIISSLKNKGLHFEIIYIVFNRHFISIF